MNDLNQILSRPEFFLVILAWSIFWKGMALWKSARHGHLVWFITLLVVNTLGLLEIAYVFYLHRWDIDGGKLLAFLHKKFSRLAK
ncbi:hypothetical protein COT65_00545 [Candidatus Shapirobacteria bacterium CG09_land_8_20_14_0_10_47_13]|uniref:DUF5652 domain-containing protein n=1 Tax=Candidatus Shapirobacteria bacterium CG09_land_8_20_14_0_10_47_13 TaxID=1974481 RepID=A0A2H0WNB5_9BACT|nr:MAG: hypothetical protein COT65_00545 [Candidatus Shapirobacteria bacterium CG09_land_8_20_14_0_10_47_13]